MIPNAESERSGEGPECFKGRSHSEPDIFQIAKGAILRERERMNAELVALSEQICGLRDALQWWCESQ